MARRRINPDRPDRRFAKLRADLDTARRRRFDRYSGTAAAVVLAAVIGGAALLYLDGADDVDAVAESPARDGLSASFVECGDRRRTNCVVDGDTFWFEGQKIRLADVNTPELSQPRCREERVKGEAARWRLLELLNAAPFSLSVGSRDEDGYGRKLRTVSRAGNSLGDVLIEEGLARPWDGARHSWCGGE